MFVRLENDMRKIGNIFTLRSRIVIIGISLSVVRVNFKFILRFIFNFNIFKFVGGLSFVMSKYNSFIILYVLNNYNYVYIIFVILDICV